MSLPTVFIRQLDGHQGPVRAVRFNANGNYCVTCGGDKFLKLWNPYTGVELKSYGGHGYEVLDATASDDSARIASCSADRTVILWDVSTGQIVRKFRGHISVSIDRLSVEKLQTNYLLRELWIDRDQLPEKYKENFAMFQAALHWVVTS
jgi:WD40 repeat protein